MKDHEYVEIECVRGTDAEQLARNVRRYGFKHQDNEWRPGEGGLWYSSINAWSWAVEHDEPLLVFEDDAMPTAEFSTVLASIEPPEGYDFASFYIPFRPPNQNFPFSFRATAQEHGNICILYSPQGARKILALL